MVKFIIICALALIAVVSCDVLTEEQLNKYTPWRKECQTLSGVEEEVAKKACKGEFIEDPKLREYVLCVSKKAGIMNEEGDINTEKLKAEVNEILKDEAKSESIVKECAIKKDSPQETAFEASKCVTKQLPQRENN